MIEDRIEFAGFIAGTLARHPEWHRDALEAVSTGMAAALGAANDRAALSSQATLAVMALASGGRIGKELRETLLARVVAAIHPAGQCGYERGYVDMYTKEPAPASAAPSTKEGFGHE